MFDAGDAKTLTRPTMIILCCPSRFFLEPREFLRFVAILANVYDDRDCNIANFVIVEFSPPSQIFSTLEYYTCCERVFDRAE